MPRTPILSANVFVAAESGWADPGAGPVPRAALRSVKWVGGGKAPAGANLRYLTGPYRIVERDGIRVAIFGLTTHSLDRIVAARKNRGVAIGSPVAAARDLVPRLRKEADLVIALSHLGVDADRDLVDRVPGIDVVIGGHSHTPLFRPTLEKSEGGRATPIAQAGSWGRYLGRTTLRWGGDRARAAFGRLLEVRPEEGEAADVEAVLASYRARLGADLDRIVCRLPRRVETKGLSEGDHPLGNFVADVIRSRTGADIAIMNAGGIRSPLPGGEVRERDILSMLPFDNRLVVVRMSGAKVRSLLDGMARRYGKGGFGHASGVAYVARRGRAVEISVGGDGATRGEPLDGNRVYRVATIDFLADGGDYFDELRDAEPKERTEILLSTAAIEYLKANPDYRFGTDGRVRWRGSTEALRDLGVR
ncbi:MAG TPA: 5'-nucleotidase C-terminal domain-containing protein [Acidobacteriota bacterium]|nr:5'-nucleotidase C-terminal domain-containing protein [Acidobacteriota bacterium]